MSRLNPYSYIRDSKGKNMVTSGKKLIRKPRLEDLEGPVTRSQYKLKEKKNLV
jgi:hypothetical protein